MIVGYKDIDMNLVSPEAKEKLELLHSLKREFYLIGSHYYGTAKEGSDVDLMTGYIPTKTYIFLLQNGFNHPCNYADDAFIDQLFRYPGIDIQSYKMSQYLNSRIQIHKVLKDLFPVSPGLRAINENKESRQIMWTILSSVLSLRSSQISGLCELVQMFAESITPPVMEFDHRIGLLLEWRTKSPYVESHPRDNDIPEIEEMPE